MPAAVAQLRERFDEDGVALTRGQRSDAQKIQGVMRCARARRRLAVGAWLDYADSRDRHFVGAEKAGRPLARDDDAPDERERAALGALQHARIGFGESGLERERVVDEADDAQTSIFRVEHALEPRERETVDHDDAAGLDRR